jgi:phosphate transport system protein
MRNAFDRQLQQLHGELVAMGALCEDAISSAAEGLFQGDAKLAAGACDAERELDRREREVEDECFKLLLRQQPVASDLRTVSAALKMISDLERIGDQAADIAELIRHVQLPDGSGRVLISEMARRVIGMVTDSVDAFVRRDLELARSVYAADDQVDALFLQVRAELIEYLAAGRGDGGVGLDLLMVAKYLERIGDHATNVAEWVEYALTGVHPQGNEKIRE